MSNRLIDPCLTSKHCFLEPESPKNMVQIFPIAVSVVDFLILQRLDKRTPR
jgi:hypothetical protein